MRLRRIASDAARGSSPMFRIFGLGLLLPLLLSSASSAKCALVFVFVEGAIEKNQEWEKLTIAVSISPDANSDFENPEISDGRFRARIPFDPTLLGTRTSHDCSRTPTEVSLRLFSGGEEVDRRTLSITNDFVRTPEGDYRQAADLTLGHPENSKQTSEPCSSSA